MLKRAMECGHRNGNTASYLFSPEMAGICPLKGVSDLTGLARETRHSLSLLNAVVQADGDLLKRRIDKLQEK